MKSFNGLSTWLGIATAALGMTAWSLAQGGGQPPYQSTEELEELEILMDPDDDGDEGRVNIGAGITYQGVLLINGSPPPTSGPNSTIDFQFQLYDALTLGNATGSLLTVNDFAAFSRTGAFTISGLNFGAAGFDGNERYMEIRMRDGASTGPYTALAPRQRVAPTPYALKANAASALDARDGSPASAVYVNDDGLVGIGTTSPAHRLQVVDTLPGELSMPLRIDNVSSTAGTSTSIGFKVTGTIVPKAALAYERTATFGRGKFHFLQHPSANDDPVNLTHSVMTIDNAGRVGLGDTAPLARLHVATFELDLTTAALENDGIVIESQDASLGLYSSPAGAWGSAVSLKEISAGTLVDTWAIVRRTSTTSNPSALLFTYGPSDNYATNPASLAITSSGQIGIGTNTPDNKLSVVGAIHSTSGGFVFPDGTTQTTAATGGAGFWSVSGTNIFNNNMGNVGIGTNTPTSKLHVVGDTLLGALVRIGAQTNPNAQFGFLNGNISVAGLGSYLRLNHLGQLRVSLQAGTSDLLDTGRAGAGLLLVNQANQTGVELGIATAPTGSGGASYLKLYDGTGANAVEIHSDSSNSAPELRMYRSNGTTETVRIQAEDDAGQGARIMLWRGNGQLGIDLNADEGLNRGADLTLYNNAGLPLIEIDADYGDTGRGYIVMKNNAATPVATVQITGNYNNTGVGRVITDVLEITGADLAEKFPTSEVIEPGMVVAIDTRNEGQLCLARGAYNRTVAGVASGANGFSVGAILGSKTDSSDHPPIALAGRVYVWVDADTAPVRPGDMLTTSETPGHAMKVQDYAAAQGAIIGKAMGSLDSGRGLVLVLINLQ